MGLPKSSLVFATFVIVALLFRSSLAGLQWRYCAGNDGGRAKVHRISQSPSPAVPGQDLNLKVEAYMSEALTGGRVLGDFTGFQIRENVCDKPSKCPIGPGEVSMNVSRKVPEMARAMAGRKAFGKIKILDPKGAEFVCVRVGIPIKED